MTGPFCILHLWGYKQRIQSLFESHIASCFSLVVLHQNQQLDVDDLSVEFSGGLELVLNQNVGGIEELQTNILLMEHSQALKKLSSDQLQFLHR